MGETTTSLKMAIECATECVVHHLKQKEYRKAKRISRALEILVDCNQEQRVSSLSMGGLVGGASLSETTKDHPC